MSKGDPVKNSESRVGYYNNLYLCNKRNLSWEALRRNRNSTNKRLKMRLLQQFLVDYINAS